MGRHYLILHGLGQLCSSEGHDVYSESGGRITSVLKSSVGDQNPGTVKKGYLRFRCKETSADGRTQPPIIRNCFKSTLELHS